MRRVVQGLPGIAAALLLAGCGSSSAAGIEDSRQAYEALQALGVPCAAPEIGDSSGLPYTRIGCTGLQIEWIGDVDRYDDLWRSDCAAVLAADRASMADIVLVKGPRWVVRGNGAEDINAWPKEPPPEQVADKLDGEVLTAAAFCQRVGAWDASP